MGKNTQDSVQAESIVLESIKKAGKVLSQKNHAKLDEALALISEIKEAASPQEEDEMKVEDIAEIVKQAVEPLATKLDKIEKQVNGEEVEPTPEEQTEEEKAAAVIQKALEPITKRLENIENAASIRKGLDPDEEVTPGQQIKKSKWAGLNL